MITLPEIASVDEVAEYLRLTPDKVRRLASAGKIGSIKIGVRRTFPREAVEEFVADNTIAATPANPHGLTDQALGRVRNIRGGRRA